MPYLNPVSELSSKVLERAGAGAWAGRRCCHGVTQSEAVWAAAVGRADIYLHATNADLAIISKADLGLHPSLGFQREGGEKVV